MLVPAEQQQQLLEVVLALHMVSAQKKISHYEVKKKVSEMQDSLYKT
jgi:hypothetical protein